MPAQSSYDYAVIRLVPDVERGEFRNVGVILFSKEREALLVRTEHEQARLRSIAPTVDVDEVSAHLASIEHIAAGGPEAGPLGSLSASQRFHWLVAPRSTMIQVSPVHPGLCADPAAELDRLYHRLVEQRTGT